MIDRSAMIRRVVTGVWLILFLGLGLSAYNDWRLLGAYDKWAFVAVGVVGYLRRVLFPSPGPSPSSSWIVSIEDDAIVTSDGRSPARRLDIADLRRVVIATDDTGPWGADLVFLLYADAEEPVGIFPLEARGCQDFVGWMSRQPGYVEQEYAKAIGSTDVARFEVLRDTRA